MHLIKRCDLRYVYTLFPGDLKNDMNQLPLLVLPAFCTALVLWLTVVGSAFPKNYNTGLTQKNISADTTLPGQTEPTSRQAPAWVILPGSRLDTNFNTFPAPNLGISKIAPAWLWASESDTPTYVIDGKLATAEQLQNLQQKEVASVERINGSKAAGLYGRNARNGLTIITMKPRLKRKL